MFLFSKMAQTIFIKFCGFIVHSLGESLQTVRENAEIFIKASKDIGLEANSDKTKYMMKSRHQNIVQTQNIVIGNLSL